MNVVFPKAFEYYLKSPKRFNIIEGGRGGGKSHTVAESNLIDGLGRKIRVLNTREIQKSIKESVHQLYSDKIKERKYPYQIFNNQIRCPLTKSDFYFHGLQDKTAANLKSFEGVDICWIEEAQTITKKSLDILIPTIRKDGSRLVFTMNRFEEADPVYDRFVLQQKLIQVADNVWINDDVLHIKVNYYDNPFCPEVLKREAEQCKSISYEDFMHIWEGEPMQQGDRKILKISKIKAAMERNIEAVGAFEIGIDVARFGDDRTVITKRQGLKCISQNCYTKLRGYEVAQRAIEIAGTDDCIFKVDDTGVGGAVTDELFRLGKNVIPVNNAQSPKDKNKYPNAINEMWFEFAEMIDTIQLPNDPELLKELAGREYTFDKLGRRVIESKDDFKKRYTKSPDKADSALLAFYGYYKWSGFA